MTIDTGALADRLTSTRNPDGGWGYYPGKASRLEPTAWACLALSAHAGRSIDTRVLSSWPSDAGLLLEHAGGMPNYGFHGLALLVMTALRVEHVVGIDALTAGIQRVKGIALKNGPANPTQDNTLQAWSWIADTFSWVEPTGWCLLSLKKRRATGGPVDGARIAEAEKLLINRACASGGWNYGNADVLGQDLRAYVPTTAIGLLAMQGRQGEPAIMRSLEFLDQHSTSEVSGSALALALLALRTYGRPGEAVRERLLTQLPMTFDLANNASIAMALYALGTEQRYAEFSL